MTDLSIIILSFNTKEITKDCLEHLNRQLKKDSIKAEIIVIDNNSSDGSVEMLKSYPNIRLFPNKINVGFPKGNNQGVKHATGRYILFLNSDVYIKNASFSDMLNYLDKNKQVAALTLKLVSPNGTIDPASHRGFPTLWNSFCYFLFLEKVFGGIPFINRIFGGYHQTYRNTNQTHEIDSPSGAFYLVRKDVLQKAQGFSEDYFMYGEDLDLSYRIRNLGYKIIYYPKWDALHLKYASGLGKQHARIERKTKDYFYDSMKIFYRKHYADKYYSLVNKAVYFLIDLKRKIS